MQIILRELAELVQGSIVGDSELIIRAARPLTDASEGDITFIEDPKYLAVFQSSNAQAAITTLEPLPTNKTVLRVKDPLTAFVTIFQKFHPEPKVELTGIHPSAQIHSSARISETAAIGPFVIVGEDCFIGPGCQLHAGVSVGPRSRLEENVILYSHVVLYKDTRIGKRVIIHANAVLGADGFGYRMIQGAHKKVPQLGHVEIGDDVEIGANTTIDRATFGATRVGQGTKIDNLVMIGHNCQIGRHNIIVSQVALAGSVTTGDYVVLAGQSGVCSHVHIGDRVVVGAKSGISKDVPADSKMLGVPATTLKEQMRMKHAILKLPQIRHDLKSIKEQLGMLEEAEV
ncbi:MAG: UDP-3-O-(3-hydroxymyristoyl)glucosamine N-acyltransferase [Planctomycetes bacterium]|nr:UDP-3-O-(3-hydroxymyristoyl)glucosamine N-acyltransferase [Planctomycetota bacterium]